MASSEPLSRLERALRRAGHDLNDLGRRWALVGGLAVSARTEPRFTRDIDLVVSVANDADAERLVHDLQARGCFVSQYFRRFDSPAAALRVVEAFRDFFTRRAR